jgi:hypothetical protein
MSTNICGVSSGATGRFLVLGLFAAVAPALAHDMDLQLRWLPDGALEGALIYSDDAPAAGNFIQVSVIDDPDFSPLALQTGEQGTFRVPLQPWRRYAVTAEGEEGHRVTVLTAAEPDPGAAEDPAHGHWPPIYLVLGGVLLLSLPLARRLRA